MKYSTVTNSITLTTEAMKATTADGHMVLEHTRDYLYHVQESAKYHKEAVRYYENGDLERSRESGNKAHIHHVLAAKCKRETRQAELAN